MKLVLTFKGEHRGTSAHSVEQNTNSISIRIMKFEELLATFVCSSIGTTNAVEVPRRMFSSKRFPKEEYEIIRQ